MMKHILVPVDGSQYMERNITYACDIARSMRSRLTLVHIVTVPTIAEPSVIIDLKPFEEAGAKIIEKAKKVAKNQGVDAETRTGTTYGNPAQAIIKIAEEGKVDLIVIGAKGHSLLRNLMVGSVTDTVVHNASCPVLVVR